MKNLPTDFFNLRTKILLGWLVSLTLLSLSMAVHAQSNYPNYNNKPNPVNSNNGLANPMQPPVRVMIDGNQLINQQANTPKARPTQSDNLSSAPAPNNVRIGSGGQYSDSNSGKTEQINSSGQLCQTNQGVKKCY